MEEQLEDLVLEINGLKFTLEVEVMDFIRMTTKKSDAMLYFIEGKITKEDLLKIYPDIKINSNE